MCSNVTLSAENIASIRWWNPVVFFFFLIVKPSSSTIMYVVSSEVSCFDHDLSCPSRLTCSLSRRTRQLQNGASSSGWRAASSLVAPYSSWFSARVKSSGGPTVIRGQAESTSSSLLTSKTKARRLWIAPTPADGKHKRCDRYRWISFCRFGNPSKWTFAWRFFFFFLHLKCWQMTQFWNFFLGSWLVNRTISHHHDHTSHSLRPWTFFIPDLSERIPSI